jgi:regulatory Fis family protein
VDRWQLIDHLVDVALAEDPGTIAERLLRALLAFNGGAFAALFEAEFDSLRLFASRGVDQAALDAADALWRSRRDELQAGRPVFTTAVMAFPVLRDRHLAGVLFAERSPSAGSSDPRELQALSQFARVAARALAGGRGEAAAYLAATPPAEVARDQLFAILEHHEWNIARVARLLKVTRPTIYARLQRLGLPRHRLRLGKRQET